MACNNEGAYDRRKNQYEKIVNVYLLTKELALLSSDKELSNFLDKKIGIVPLGEFESTVDLSSPHMWLETRMNIAESRLAYVLNELTKENKFNEALILTKKFGSENHKTDFSSLEEAYEYYLANVLDGMPCDETKEVIENTPECLIWNKAEDVHEKFYKEIGLDVSYYYELLKDYVEGLFENSNIKFSVENNQKFSLKY